MFITTPTSLIITFAFVNNKSYITTTNTNNIIAMMNNTIL